MEAGSKSDLVVESPPVYFESPNGWTAGKKKKLLIVSVVVIVLSLLVVAAVLIGLKMSQDHTEKIFQMAFKNPDGTESQQTATVNKQENVVTFYVSRSNSSYTVLYDYTNSLICVRKDSKACYLTKMDKSKIPSLDSISSSFQNPQSSSGSSTEQESETTTYIAQKEPVADRWVLGHNINVLCSNVPIQWARESKGSQSRSTCITYFYDCYTDGQTTICKYITYC